MGKRKFIILSTTIHLLDTLNQELDSIMKYMFNEKRKQLTYFEIEHMIKMTEHVVIKIKKQTKTVPYEYTEPICKIFL